LGRATPAHGLYAPVRTSDALRVGGPAFGLAVLGIDRRRKRLIASVQGPSRLPPIQPGNQPTVSAVGALVSILGFFIAVGAILLLAAVAETKVGTRTTPPPPDREERPLLRVYHPSDKAAPVTGRPPGPRSGLPSTR